MPGAVNVYAYSSERSSPADPKSPVADVTVWVSSSRFVHRTVVPAGTVNTGGRYFESRMSTVAEDEARTAAPRAATTANARIAATAALEKCRRHRQPARLGPAGDLVPTPMPTLQPLERSIEAGRTGVTEAPGGWDAVLRMSAWRRRRVQGRWRPTNGGCPPSRHDHRLTLPRPWRHCHGERHQRLVLLPPAPLAPHLAAP